jgi:hypothetical protein
LSLPEHNAAQLKLIFVFLGVSLFFRVAGPVTDLLTGCCQAVTAQEQGRVLLTPQKGFR